MRTKSTSFAVGVGLGFAAMFLAGPAATAPGDVIDNSGLIPFQQSFFAFEVESPLGTLKEVPIWDELEQMLDNPYDFVLDPTVEGNFQGFPSYRSTQARRRSFIFRNASGEPCAPLSSGCAEVPLAGHIIHPLNYNFQGGEELRVLNVDFEETEWMTTVPDQRDNDDPQAGYIVTDPCDDPECGPGQIRYDFNMREIVVSAGEERIEDDEVAIDYNSPMAPDTFVCSTLAEANPPPEGSLVCGGDFGEPGYLGFGVLGKNRPARRAQYSVPAVPGGTADPMDVNNGAKGSIVGLQLFDPARGFIKPRNAGGQFGLRKPSLRVSPGGSPANPGYLLNSEASLASDPAGLTPSNENDYYAGRTRPQKVAARDAAAALGKAFFWDMQVGSDSVQACASCHFHAGVDNRTKGQLNSNTTGGDLDSFETVGADGTTTILPNGEVGAASFPLHKLVNPDIPTDPLVNPGNIARTTNDVMSSMGVSRFTEFVDIPAIGTFLPATNGVASVPPDIGMSVTDPVTINDGFRRVEPRHTPTFFASTMNFDNFWDGRARHDFNGGSVFGASDPQSHVMVDDGGTIVATRQIIRFASLASLATGPALSENEMSFAGRNWAKLGKRLLQAGVTPLANQLVDTTDSVMGLYSNQGGSACAGLPVADQSGDGTTAVGKPGLCISYPGLIGKAFYSRLWQNESMHLNGCYTDGRGDLGHTQCANVGVPVAILVLNAAGTAVVDSAADPFDNYVLSIAGGAADASDTSQFTQMEANLPLFFGLSIHAWGTILVPDDTPFDRLMDGNGDAFVSFGEAGENALVLDLDTCAHTGGVKPCFGEVGDFKRDPGVIAKLNCAGPEGPVNCDFTAAGGSRVAGSVDPLMGLDFFLGSNLSLKNSNFNTLRCGECHAGGTLTDHTFEISHQVSFNDWAQEFLPNQPAVELFPEPLGRGRVVTGFALEGELGGNAQDGVERNNADFCTIIPCVDAYGGAIPGGVVGGFPQGQALFDNGVYNIGVTPIGDDTSRGGKDAFGWPLSLSVMGLKNICGVDYHPGGDDVLTMPPFAQPGGGGIPCPRWEPDDEAINPFTGEEGSPFGGGLFEETAQDQQINPGYEEEVDEEVAQLPGHLAPWASSIPVGDEVQIDEIFAGVNTLIREPILEGFVDSFGPFNPAAILGENMNNAVGPLAGSWPNVNRVNSQGAFKAAPLRNVELTNPYFHDGGNLTLRQQLDFYMRGGNFPVTNKAHRDFLIMNLLNEDEALGAVVLPGSCDVNAALGSFARSTCRVAEPGTPGALPMFSAAEKEEIIVSVVDFLLQLTDERVAFERAPFDHPEIFVPIDARASENVAGRGTVAGAADYTLMGQTGVACTLPLAGQSVTMGVPDVLLSDVAPSSAGPTCFRQVPAVGVGGIATKLPNFLGIASGPRLVGSAANCTTVNSHYCR